MACPSCGSENISRLILNLCNDCNNVVGENRVPELDIDVLVFVKKLCGPTRCSDVYFTLLEARSAQRFTDIRDHIRITSSTLTRALHELMLEGLVRMVGKKYQALSPPWLKAAV